MTLELAGQHLAGFINCSNTTRDARVYVARRRAISCVPGIAVRKLDIRGHVAARGFLLPRLLVCIVYGRGGEFVSCLRSRLRQNGTTYYCLKFCTLPCKYDRDNGHTGGVHCCREWAKLAYKLQGRKRGRRDKTRTRAK